MFTAPSDPSLRSPRWARDDVVRFVRQPVHHEVNPRRSSCAAHGDLRHGRLRHREHILAPWRMIPCFSTALPTMNPARRAGRRAARLNASQSHTKRGALSAASRRARRRAANRVVGHDADRHAPTRARPVTRFLAHSGLIHRTSARRRRLAPPCVCRRRAAARWARCRRARVCADPPGRRTAARAATRGCAAGSTRGSRARPAGTPRRCRPRGRRTAHLGVHALPPISSSVTSSPTAAFTKMRPPSAIDDCPSPSHEVARAGCRRFRPRQCPSIAATMGTTPLIATCSRNSAPHPRTGAAGRLDPRAGAVEEPDHRDPLPQRVRAHATDLVLADEPIEPAITVKSYAATATSRPAMRPTP